MSDASSAKARPTSTGRPAEARARLLRAPLRVGGLTPCSTTDWPGQLSAVVFCQGCPWRCSYCHNPHLLPSRGANELAWVDVLAFLRRRVGLLDAVVFSGGEPLAQAALVDAIRAVRQLGFRVGLHTGGAYPSRLSYLLPFLDWVGFDFKAPVPDYPAITGAPGSGRKALASARALIRSGVQHEFRTTVHRRWHDATTLVSMADQLAALGVRRYVLQAFRAQGCADTALENDAPVALLEDSRIEKFAHRFESFALRAD
jgi:pyruvate formate lyase activating enzyme